MIILDTNVISETQRKRPDSAVMGWLDGQDGTNLYLTSITAAELIFGVHSLPEGRRRDGLLEAVTGILEEDFDGRILSFDATAAWHYGEAIAAARKKGQSISTADGQIASIALARPGAKVATRDRTPFTALGVNLIDPWTFDVPVRR